MTSPERHVPPCAATILDSPDHTRDALVERWSALLSERHDANDRLDEVRVLVAAVIALCPFTKSNRPENLPYVFAAARRAVETALGGAAPSTASKMAVIIRTARDRAIGEGHAGQIPIGA